MRINLTNQNDSTKNHKYVEVMKEKLIEFLATGFYLGKSPKAPGTVGTLLGIPLSYVLLQLPPPLFMMSAFAFVLFSVFIAHWYEQIKGVHDLGEVVIDEVAGYLVTMAFLPITWMSFVAAFLLFRLFDIWKPYPISVLDERVKGGLGVVVDDIAAGMIANMILQIVVHKTAWLGVG